MKAAEQYAIWMKRADDATRSELKSIADDPAELEDRFGRTLEFGTGGLRGVMGAGLNRMNVYTVRQATQGLADTVALGGEAEKAKGVVVAYDSRNHSAEFAREAARVLAGAGIPAYLFDALRPTPELSFAIRHLHAVAGLNITASHNPKQYNGYKVYWEDGAQIGPEKAAEILAAIRRTDLFDGVKPADFEQAEKSGLIRIIGSKVDEAFLARVLEQAVLPAEAHKGLSIVYTPFHGAGCRLVPEMLRRAGFSQVFPVPEQMIPDGNFPTVKSPNPEEKEGFTLAIALAEQTGADLIVGTDPDSDRAGVVVRDARGAYTPLTGNQVGVLLADYRIQALRAEGRLPKNAAVVTTIVSTLMADPICRENGVALFRTLTGFKFIGEKIHEFEESGSHTFLFGFEESYGYLAGTYTRDKDAVVATLLIAEMAAWYKSRGITLFEALQALYRRYGFYSERLISLKMEGFDAPERMAGIMRRLREEGLRGIGGTPVEAQRDYLSGVRKNKNGETQPTGLPESDVLYYELADGCHVVIRPSGTEPKVKLYLLAKGGSAAETAAKLDQYEAAMRALLR